MSLVFTLVRALLYATSFVAVVLVLPPAALLEWLGIEPQGAGGAPQVAGLILVAAGVGLMAWCVTTFAVIGRGTPAPFDPPRRLVRSGPYGVVRNPMYIGAGSTLMGAALYYGSLVLLALVLAFGVAASLFVRFYEEPTLTRLFGSDYRAYRERVPRWWPGRRPDRR